MQNESSAAKTNAASEPNDPGPQGRWRDPKVCDDLVVAVILDLRKEYLKKGNVIKHWHRLLNTMRMAAATTSDGGIWITRVRRQLQLGAAVKDHVQRQSDLLEMLDAVPTMLPRIKARVMFYITRAQTLAGERAEKAGENAAEKMRRDHATAKAKNNGVADKAAAAEGGGREQGDASDEEDDQD